jgi:hypothetical protein
MIGGGYNARKPKSKVDVERKNAQTMRKYAEDSIYDMDILRLQGLTICSQCSEITPLNAELCCACDKPHQQNLD